MNPECVSLWPQVKPQAGRLDDAQRVRHLLLCVLIQKSELTSNLGQEIWKHKVGMRYSGRQSGLAEGAPEMRGGVVCLNASAPYYGAM